MLGGKVKRGEHHGEAQGSYTVIKEVLAFIFLVSRPHQTAFFVNSHGIRTQNKGSNHGGLSL